jgi:hypothetical protein
MVSNELEISRLSKTQKRQNECNIISQTLLSENTTLIFPSLTLVPEFEVKDDDLRSAIRAQLIQAAMSSIPVPKTSTANSN